MPSSCAQPSESGIGAVCMLPPSSDPVTGGWATIAAGMPIWAGGITGVGPDIATPPLYVLAYLRSQARMRVCKAALMKCVRGEQFSCGIRV